MRIFKCMGTCPHCTKNYSLWKFTNARKRNFCACENFSDYSMPTPFVSVWLPLFLLLLRSTSAWLKSTSLRAMWAGTSFAIPAHTRRSWNRKANQEYSRATRHRPTPSANNRSRLQLDALFSGATRRTQSSRFGWEFITARTVCCRRGITPSLIGWWWNRWLRLRWETLQVGYFFFFFFFFWTKILWYACVWVCSLMCLCMRVCMCYYSAFICGCVFVFVHVIFVCNEGRLCLVTCLSKNKIECFTWFFFILMFFFFWFSTAFFVPPWSSLLCCYSCHGQNCLKQLRILKYRKACVQHAQLFQFLTRVVASVKSCSFFFFVFLRLHRAAPGVCRVLFSGSVVRIKHTYNVLGCLGISTLPARFPHIPHHIIVEKAAVRLRHTRGSLLICV